MTLLDPRFWLAAIGYSLVLILTTAGFVTHHERVAAALAEADHTAAALAEQQQADDAVLALERQLHRADLDQFNLYRKEQADAHADKDHLIDRLRTGADRLRVPVRAVCPAAPDPGRPAAAGSGDQGHAELSPDAALFVVGLLGRGDDAIAKHAAVVDAYERLRLTCTQPPPQQPGDTDEPHH